MTSHASRPRDKNQLAKMIVDIATDQVEDGFVAATGRAVRGKTSSSPSPERRGGIAKQAAAVHWRNLPGKLDKTPLRP